MMNFNNIYNGRKVIVTGNTGFKGSWLNLWLNLLGANVTGISLKPETEPNHFNLLNLQNQNNSYFENICNYNEIFNIFKKEQPEIVFHLAAQALVRKSYKQPLETLKTNVIGTANIIEAARLTPSVKAIIIITTDKCYENDERLEGYKEEDRLGGYDLYSCSKACAELVSKSYRCAFLNNDNNPLLATVRAGNVIGGGDWSEDRLIPDAVKAIRSNKVLEIRSPNATRPWQHVLEPLSGYLLLGQKLLEGKKEFEQAFNFGPDNEGNKTVEKVLKEAKNNWLELNWQAKVQENNPHEANFLHLNCDKAKKELGWKPSWNFKESIVKTIEWYKKYYENNNIITKIQIEEYMNGN